MKLRRQQEAVHRILALLRQHISPSSYRVCHMRWMEQRTIQQIAMDLHLTPERVSYRLHRLKKRFRLLFDQTFGNSFSPLP